MKPAPARAVARRAAALERRIELQPLLDKRDNSRRTTHGAA